MKNSADVDATTADGGFPNRKQFRRENRRWVAQEHSETNTGYTVRCLHLLYLSCPQSSHQMQRKALALVYEKDEDDFPIGKVLS